MVAQTIIRQVQTAVHAPLVMSAGAYVLGLGTEEWYNDGGPDNGSVIGTSL